MKVTDSPGRVERRDPDVVPRGRLQARDVARLLARGDVGGRKPELIDVLLRIFGVSVLCIPP